MMFEFPLLLGALEDILKVIVPLMALIIWILSQVFGQKAGKPDAPPAGNPRPQAPPNEGGLRQEIERFLREAKQQQDQQQQKQTPRERELNPRAEAPATSEKQSKQERQRRKEAKQREMARQRAKELAAGNQSRPVDAEVVEDVMVVGPGSALSQQVSSYMNSGKFRESASHLGEQVGLADERLASHLHQTFDHQLGNLAGQPNEVERGGAAQVRTVVGGTELSAMLRDPQTFRQAIVLNEILTRPEHRWD